MGPETVAEKLQQTTTYITDLEAKLHVSQSDRGAVELAAADESFWSVIRRLIEAEAALSASVHMVVNLARRRTSDG